MPSLDSIIHGMFQDYYEEVGEGIEEYWFVYYGEIMAALFEAYMEGGKECH